jgi:hypothetical protein
MDRRLASAVTLITATLLFHQRPVATSAESGPAHRPVARQAEAAQARNRTPLPSELNAGEKKCGVGASCDALIPYRDSGPWKASCDWFIAAHGTVAARGESVPLEGNDPEELGQSMADWCLPSAAWNADLKFLIVTLPDPVTTHLALYFDRTIEMVEAALQQSKQYLSRYWLPWRPTAVAAGGDTSQDLRVVDILNDFRLKQPGLLMFVGDPRDAAAAGSAAPPPLDVTYVFLVSESPTSGIDKIQFENAVRYSKVLGAPDTTPLPVVGPFFSGSVVSAVQLNADLRQKSNIQSPLAFVSGTLTSDDQRKYLSDNKMQIRVMLHDDATAKRFLLESLRARKLTHNGSNVAILKEDETLYGGWSENDAAAEGQVQDGFQAVRYITFPRELSRLRNASSDAFTSSSTGTGASMPAPAQELSWNWKDTSSGEDSAPSFSGSQEPLSQEAVLRSIADTIREQNIRYVGIVATDIFDILFLSRFLRTAAPNTRLFLLDADLLMTLSGSDGRELNGTLAVTTYPLFARNVDWTTPQPQSAPPGAVAPLTVFPSRMAEGVYDAVLFQLDPSGCPAKKEYADPLSNQSWNDRPPLWLTIVGRTGFWPISLRDTADPSAPSPCEGSTELDHGLVFDPPEGVTILLQGALILLGTFQLVGLVLSHFDIYVSWLSQVQLGSRFRRGTNTQYHSYYLKCGTLALSMMLLLVTMCVTRLRWDGRPIFGFVSTFIYIMIGLVGVALLAEAIFIEARRAFTAITCWIRLLPWIIYVGTLSVWTILTFGVGADGLFFAQRSFYVGNGVSPLLPVELLLLLYYVWSWMLNRKVRLSEKKEVYVPDPAHLGVGGVGLRRYVEQMRAATDGLPFHPDPKVVGGTLLGYAVAFGLARPWVALRSVEGRLYDSLIQFLCFLIGLLVFLTGARYFYIWSQLRRILRGLERTPLHRTFGRFPPATYSWSQLWYDDAWRRTYTISARSLECFQALQNCHEFAAVCTQHLDRMTRTFRRVIAFENDARKTQQLSYAVRILQRRFVRAADALLTKLARKWALEGGSDTLRAAEPCEPPGGADIDCRSLAEEFVALRYISLINFESAQLKNLVVLLSLGFVLALAALAAYPFLAGRAGVWTLAGVFVVFGAAIVVSFAQMDRDAILSKLADGTPGKLDWSFYIRVASYGALPLLALLASQFPSVGRSLFSWLEPALSALH